MRKLLLTGLSSLAISSCGVQPVGFDLAISSCGVQPVVQPVGFEYEPSEKMAVPILCLTNRLERELEEKGQTLVNEKILCLKGYKSKDRIVATEYFMPVHKVSTPKRASAESCPSDIVTRWHNHPPGKRNECYLSSVDIKDSISSRHPIYIVQVREGYCWWTLKQIEERKDHIRIIPIENQFRFNNDN